MKIFLDDVRYPRDCHEYMKARISLYASLYNDKGWIVCRNYDQFKEAIDQHKGIITHISFDHDLADEHYNPTAMVNDDEYEHLRETFVERTGLDCARYLKQEYLKEGFELPICFVHSMNPVGRQSIIDELKDLR